MSGPAQYATDQRCDECKRPLSRYNPYTICGPCRVDAFGRLAAGVAESPSLREMPTTNVWDDLPRRRPVHYGPVLPDTPRE